MTLYKAKFILTILTLIAWLLFPFIHSFLLYYFDISNNATTEDFNQFKFHLVPLRDIIYNLILVLSIFIIIWTIFRRFTHEKLSKFEVTTTLLLTLFTLAVLFMRFIIPHGPMF